MYKPKITLKEREGKVSIWIDMPDGELYNIWDLPTETATNEQVLKAIASAFERGMRAAFSLVNEAQRYIFAPDIDMKAIKEKR